jgi:hypothetical protein
MAQTAGTFMGHLMGIYISDVRISVAKGVNLSMGSAMRDMNNSDTGDFDTVKPGRRNWSASGNCHFTFDAGYSFEDLLDAWKAGTLLVCRFSTENPGDIDFSGNGYIESLKASFSDHENATYDFSIKGATDLSKSTNT